MKKSRIGILSALLLVALAALLASASVATALEYESLRYRIVKHSSTYDIVRGHGKKLMVRKQYRYVDTYGAFRYRVIKRTQSSIILRRVSPGIDVNTAITTGAVLPTGLPAAASSSREGYDPPAGNDGASATRWTADSKSYPQWWMVDLGQETALTGVKTTWFNGFKRAYRYQIETSLDGVTFSTAADRSSNLLKGPNTDAFSATARYVRIRVLGERIVGASAAISEVAVYADSGVPAPEPSETPTPAPTDTEPSATPTPSPTDSAPAVTPTPTPTETVAPAAPGIQADHYVAKTGSDANDGSAARPWLTIQKAASSITPGEVVSVAAGTYNERVTMASSKSGTADNHTALIADGTVVVAQGFDIQSDFTDLSGFEITPGSSAAIPDASYRGVIYVQASNITLKNLNIHDCSRASAICLLSTERKITIENCTMDNVKHACISSTNGMAGAHASYVTVKGCTMKRWGGEVAVYAYGDNWLIEDCEIRGINAGWQGAPVWNGDGIWPNFGSHTVIRRCRIYDIWPYKGYASGQHADCIQFWNGTHDLLVDSCYLGSWKRGGLDGIPGPTNVVMCGTCDSSCDVTFQNCVFLAGIDASTTLLTNSHTFCSAVKAGFQLTVRLFNNTFYGNAPSLTNGGDGGFNLVARNNAFYSHRGSWFASGTDSDYNAFMWNDWADASKIGLGSSSVYTGEGAHSLGRTAGTRLLAASIFVDPAGDAGHNYGLAADFRPKAGSALLGSGDPAYAPPYDITGAPRSTTSPSIGAYE